MIGVSIRSIKESDLDLIYAFCKNEHWNYSLKMVERLFLYEPNGCFAADVKGKLVGHVFSFNYGKIGWIGMLIVNKEHRRQGIGTLLMKRAMKYLLDIGVKTIRLEAVPEFANIYYKLGFTSEFDSFRFQKINEKCGELTELSVEPVKRNEIVEIANFDRKYFGADRRGVLCKLYEDNPELCFVSRRGSRIVGYIMCDKTEMGYRIGPWVCNPQYTTIAKKLILNCIETIKVKERLYVGAPAVNDTAVKILQELNFKLYSKSIRMYFGKKIEDECIEGIFSIGGPEKG